MFRLALVFALLMAPLTVAAQSQDTPEPTMTYERLGRIIFALDPEAQPDGVAFRMQVRDVPVLVVTDTEADRVRAMVHVRSAADLSAQDLMRMMQANFDSTLDARYAVAGGQLWAVFIHPLGPLEKDQFISGLAQAVNTASSYGTLYSSGVGQYGGGDSEDLQRELFEELLKKGEEI
ncbi:MAG: hypothetical protein OIF47_03220 [Marinibacterium sp.]|nr:hypothetical protein [Marinibacterium sp.]